MYWTYFHKSTCIKNEGLHTSFGTSQSKNISTDFITHRHKQVPKKTERKLKDCSDRAHVIRVRKRTNPKKIKIKPNKPYYSVLTVQNHNDKGGMGKQGDKTQLHLNSYEQWRVLIHGMLPSLINVCKRQNPKESKLQSTINCLNKTLSTI